MCSGKNEHRFVKDQHIIQRPLLGAFSLVMNDRSPRIIVVLPTSSEQAPAEVDVFSVHEVLLVQQTNLIQCFTAHPHKRTA